MNKRDADDASSRGFLARRTRRVSAFPRYTVSYQFTSRESCIVVVMYNHDEPWLKQYQ